MNNANLSPIQKIVLISMGTSVTAVGAFIAIPLPFSPVPIVLQNFFVLLIALVFGARMGIASVALYLFLGGLGLPVFAGARGGFAHFYGPTGGYLIGFLLAAWITGVLRSKHVHCSAEEQTARALVCKDRHRYFLKDAAAALAGMLSVYLFGVPWLAHILGLGMERALLLGFLPFLPGDLLKAAAAVFLAPVIRSLVAKEFYVESRGVES